MVDFKDEAIGIEAASSDRMVIEATLLGLLACPPPDPSRLELVGVLLDDEPAERVAVLHDRAGNRSFTVHPRDVIEGSNALQVEAGALVVRRHRARVERIDRGRVLLSTPQGLEVASSSTAWVEQRECRPLVDVNAMTEQAHQVRIVPTFERGKANGFKLLSIRPGSAWSRAGLQNGDVIERVNGLDLTSPEKALVVYSTLRCARRFNVELRRGAERVDLTLLPADEAAGHHRARSALLEHLRSGDVVTGVDDDQLTLRFVRAGARRRALVRSIEPSSPDVVSATRAREFRDTGRRTR